MVVQHNLSAMNTNRQMGTVQLLMPFLSLQRSYHQVIRLTEQQMMQPVFLFQRR